MKKVRDRNEVIFGADINIRIGTRDSDAYKRVLGPNGIESLNGKGKKLLGVYASENLMIESLFSSTTITVHITARDMTQQVTSYYYPKVPTREYKTTKSPTKEQKVITEKLRCV